MPFSPLWKAAASTAVFVVVYPRGRSQQTPDDVLAEAVHLAEQGVREINLLGQNVNAYEGCLMRARSLIWPC